MPGRYFFCCASFYTTFVKIRLWEHGQKGVTDRRTAARSLVANVVRQTCDVTCRTFLGTEVTCRFEQTLSLSEKSSDTGDL